MGGLVCFFVGGGGGGGGFRLLGFRVAGGFLRLEGFGFGCVWGLGLLLWFGA